MNISDSLRNEESLAELFKLLAQPARLQILLAIGQGEACVCHLETVLGLRQAHISQHLMALRAADLVTAYRDGRNIYYQLSNPQILAVIQQAAQAQGAGDWVRLADSSAPMDGCPCPRCAEAAGLSPDQARQIACDLDSPACEGGEGVMQPGEAPE